MQEIRLERLRSILKQRYRGVVAALARAIDKDVNQTRFILNPTRPGGRRIGEKLARQIEKKLGLSAYALDTDTGSHLEIAARIDALPVALRVDLIQRLEVAELAAKELPFAFAYPIDPARAEEFANYMETLTEKLRRAKDIESTRLKRKA